MQNNRDGHENVFAEDEEPQLQDERTSPELVQSSKVPSCPESPIQVSGKRKRSREEDPEQDFPDRISRSKIPRLSMSHLDDSAPLHLPCSDFRYSNVTPVLAPSPSYDPHEWMARILASSDGVETRVVLQVNITQLENFYADLE